MPAPFPAMRVASLTHLCWELAKARLRHGLKSKSCRKKSCILSCKMKTYQLNQHLMRLKCMRKCLQLGEWLRRAYASLCQICSVLVNSRPRHVLRSKSMYKNKVFLFHVKGKHCNYINICWELRVRKNVYRWPNC